MTDRDIAFKNYIESFKGLDKDSKKKEIIDSLRELIDYFNELTFDENVNIDYLNEYRQMDIDDENMSDDDFYNASITYLEAAKDIIAQYLGSMDDY